MFIRFGFQRSLETHHYSTVCSLSGKKAAIFRETKKFIATLWRRGGASQDGHLAPPNENCHLAGASSFATNIARPEAVQ